VKSTMKTIGKTINAIVALNTLNHYAQADSTGLYFNSPDRDEFDGSALGYWERVARALECTEEEITRSKTEIGQPHLHRLHRTARTAIARGISREDFITIWGRDADPIAAGAAYDRIQTQQPRADVDAGPELDKARSELNDEAAWRADLQRKLEAANAKIADAKRTIRAMLDQTPMQSPSRLRANLEAILTEIL